MPARTAAAEGQHQTMVQGMASHLIQQRYTSVLADHPGWACPAQIVNHIPDVTAVRADGVGYVLEVETCETISDAHTHSQWSEFAWYAANNGYIFAVYVPQVCLQQSQQQATAWGIRVGEWWWI